MFPDFLLRSLQTRFITDLSFLIIFLTGRRDVKMMKLSPIRDWSPVEVEAWVNGLEEGTV